VRIRCGSLCSLGLRVVIEIMFKLKHLRHLEKLKHLGKIRKNLSDIAFELESIKIKLQEEAERCRGSIVEADCPNYDEVTKLSLDQGKEIEEFVKETVELEDDEEVVAVTPTKVYIG